MMQVRQMLVKESKYQYKCPNAMVPQYITIHNTANDTSAENEVQYMINNSNQVSFHYAVDNKEVVQGILENRNAWAASDGNGAGNRKSIHVEICYSRSGGAKYIQAESNAIKFVAQLLKKYGWGIDRVKKHQDWSGKYCPHRILSENRWQAVLNAIQAELHVLSETVSASSTSSVKEEIMTTKFEPSNQAIRDAVSTVLMRFEKKDPPLAAEWREKANAGELTNSDAIGLLFVAIERGYITGKCGCKK